MAKIEKRNQITIQENQKIGDERTIKALTAPNLFVFVFFVCKHVGKENTVYDRVSHFRQSHNYHNDNVFKKIGKYLILSYRLQT